VDIDAELSLEARRPVMVPREDERGERLGLTPRGPLRDRGSRRDPELLRATRGSRDGKREREAAIAKDLPRIIHLPNVSTVAPLRFDRSRIQSLIELAGDRLTGEWLLIGGAAAAAWFAPVRTTEDIDLIGLGGSQAERLALMELAESAAIPIEAVNTAADFYLRRIDGWRDQLVPLHRGANATVYRPSATLFILLKIHRLSAVDLDDCLALLDHCEQSVERIDRPRIHARLDTLPHTEDASLLERRARLRGALDAAEP
jgi:hypothetical protein